MIRCQSRCISWILVIVMVVSPSLAVAQPPAAARPEKIDLSYVVPDAMVGAVLRPRRALLSPSAVMFPIEVLSAVGKHDVGIDPVDVEEVILMIETPDDPLLQQAPPSFGAVVRLAKPFQLEDLKLAADPQMRQTELDGKPYAQAAHPMMPSFFMPDDRTLLVASDPLLRKMLEHNTHSTTGAMRQLLATTEPSSDLRVVVDVAANREVFTTQMGAVPVPPQWAGFLKLPELVDSIELDVALSGEKRLRLQTVSATEVDASQLRGLILQMLHIGRAAFLAQSLAQISGEDHIAQASAAYSKRMAQLIVDVFQPRRDGNRVYIAVEGQIGADVAVIGVLVALLLPALQAARNAARGAQSANNMKQLALAMHIHHEAYGRLPARANFDSDGRPLLSWRVHLLPFLEQEALYRQFRLDEPWDSPHNRQLIERMPDVFADPAATLEPGKTTYLVPISEGSIFSGTEGTRFRDISDGTSNTILLVEADETAAVVWTQPEDLKVDANQPLANVPGAGFQVGFADGSVQRLSDIDPQVFLDMLTIAGGEIINR